MTTTFSIFVLGCSIATILLHEEDGWEEGAWNFIFPQFTFQNFYTFLRGIRGEISNYGNADFNYSRLRWERWRNLWWWINYFLPNFSEWPKIHLTWDLTLKNQFLKAFAATLLSLLLSFWDHWCVENGHKLGFSSILMMPCKSTDLLQDLFNISMLERN